MVKEAANKLIDLVPVAATAKLVEETSKRTGVSDVERPNDVFGFSDENKDLFRKLD